MTPISQLASGPTDTNNGVMPIQFRKLAAFSLGLFGFYWALAPSAYGETRLISGDYLIKTWDAEDNLSGST
ncbi:MAG: hypothetical protein ACRED1_12005, partial [Limisphaerales bacterium]